MHSRFRLLSLATLALLLLALPSIGLAGDPRVGARGPRVTATVVARPALVPGASVLTVGFGDSATFHTAAGATLVRQDQGGVLSVYSSATGGYITAAPRLPSGATLWQVDVYGYTSGATTQTYELDDYDAPTGGIGATILPTSSTGPGLVHSTLSYPSGGTLTDGDAWFVTAYGADSASSAFVGAVFQYTLPTLSLIPISPTRVYDSRCTDGVLAGGSNRTISVATGISSSTCAVGPSNVVPAGAKAVAYNLTVAATTAAGWVALVPHGTSFTGTSSINWFGAGQVLANGGVVSLGGDRQLDVYAGGTVGASTYVIVDITGYYQ